MKSLCMCAMRCRVEKRWWCIKNVFLCNDLSVNRKQCREDHKFDFSPNAIPKSSTKLNFNKSYIMCLSPHLVFKIRWV